MSCHDLFTIVSVLVVNRVKVALVGVDFRDGGARLFYPNYSVHRLAGRDKRNSRSIPPDQRQYLLRIGAKPTGCEVRMPSHN